MGALHLELDHTLSVLHVIVRPCGSSRGLSLVAIVVTYKPCNHVLLTQDLREAESYDLFTVLIYVIRYSHGKPTVPTDRVDRP